MKVFSNIIKILASLGGLFILIGGVLMAVTYPYGEPYDTIVSSEYKTVIERDEEFDISKVSSITVKGNMDVIILNGIDESKITAKASGCIIRRKADKNDLVMNLNSNGELEFSLKYNFNFSIGFNSINYNRVLLEIALPSSYTGNLNLENASKDVKVNVNNTFNKVDVNSASGEITLDNFTTHILDADITSGKLSINSVNADKLDLYLTSGNIAFDKVNAKESIISITSGTVEGNNLTAEDSAYFKATSGTIKISGLKSDKVTTKMSSGKMVFTNTDTNSFETDVTSGRIEIDLVNVTTVSAKLTSGNVIITSPAPTNYNCTVSISSGSIYNNNFFASQSSKISNSGVYEGGAQLNPTLYKLSVTSGKITLNGK